MAAFPVGKLEEDSGPLSLSETQSGLRQPANRLIVDPMGDLCGLIWCAIAGPFRSRAALQAEILVLRHQLNVLRRKSPKRMAVSNIDRLVFCGLYRLAPTVLDAVQIRQKYYLVSDLHMGRRRRAAALRLHHRVH
jgi:hypothetical protein